MINTVSDEQAASEPNIRKLADKRKSEMVDFMCLAGPWGAQTLGQT